MVILALAGYISYGAAADSTPTVPTTTAPSAAQHHAAVVWQRSLIARAQRGTWKCQDGLGIPRTRVSRSKLGNDSIPYLLWKKALWRARARSCWQEARTRRTLARKIDRGLIGYPLHGHGRDLVNSGKRWNVSPALVAAISGAESTFCSARVGFNCWGWGCPHGSCNISGGSFAGMIEMVTRGLRQGYLSRGVSSVLGIALIYCPYSDGNNSAAWASSVSSWMVGRFGSTTALTYPATPVPIKSPAGERSAK